METSVLRYNVLINKEGNDYIAYVPTLGISDFGQTLDEAQNHIKAAIQTHVEGLVKTGTEVPPPDAQEFYVGSTEVSIPTTSLK